MIKLTELETKWAESVQRARQNFSLGGAVNVTLAPTATDMRDREDVYASVYHGGECLGHITGGDKPQILRFVASLRPAQRPDEIRIFMSRRDSDVNLGRYVRNDAGEYVQA